MSIDPSLMAPNATTIPQPHRILQICNFILSKGLTPKSFFQEYLTCANEEVVYRRRLLRAGDGWKTTKLLLETIRSLTRSTEEGRNNWREFILAEASFFVTQESMPHGEYPNGSFVSSKKITHEFFSRKAEEEREAEIKEGMNFLYELVQAKLLHSMNDPLALLAQVGSDVEDEESDNNTNRGSEDVGHLEEIPTRQGETLLDADSLLALEKKVYVKDPNYSTRAAHKLRMVPMIICAILGYSCNRRNNSLPLLNGLTFLASGVSARTHSYLHSIGITVSRDCVLSAMDTLADKQRAHLISVMKHDSVIRPILVYDNIDIQVHVHHSRLEASGHLFNGTWGFFLVIPEKLLRGVDRELVSLKATRKAMLEAQKTPVELGMFMPDPSEVEHWKAVIMAQLAQAFDTYFHHLPGFKKDTSPPRLNIHPPVIDLIDQVQPDIHFLRMMDAPDNSAEGVSQVFDEILRQIDQTPAAFAKELRVVGGDVGSNRLVESLRQKRFPAGSIEEALDYIITVFGPAHATWNMDKALWIFHYGNPSDAQDTGGWRWYDALGGNTEKPVGSQDFKALMEATKKVHYASLVFIIREVIKSLGEVDLTNPQECRMILELVWDSYFDVEAINLHRESANTSTYNLIMRLHDFATVVEADAASRAGDIGRLILIWKKWAIMAQGLPGLSHYSLHLPRIIILLEHDLPRDLSRVIKHTLLIPSHERAGHCLAADEFLEVHNYWLKHFYNNSGNGTDIHRLIDRFSSNIPLLRKLLHQLKIRSGLKLIFQNNKIKITGPSMANFLRIAERMMSPYSHCRSPPEVSNVFVQGIHKMRKLLLETILSGAPSKLRWGVPDGNQVWEEDEEIEIE